MTDGPALAREWEVWAAENLLRGVPRAEIEGHLVGKGVPAELASRALDAIAASPIVEAAAPFVRDARRYAMLAKARALLERAVTRPEEIERRDAPSPEEFFDAYFVPQRPVILRGLVSRWPAMERWAFGSLARDHGDAQVTITARRNEDPLYGTPKDRPTETLSLRELLARIEAETQPTNDYYLVGQNAAFDGPLKAMLDDIAMPPGWIDPARPIQNASLWIGPAGTTTRMHHDVYSVLACQVRGRKRWRMIPPTERHLLSRVRGTHTTLDPETDPLDGVLVKQGVLEPGEALFVPQGWWHHVRALEPSISVSLKSWARPVDLGFVKLAEP